MIDQYAVMGNPVIHSKSPRIHAEFAQQTGQQLQYSTLLVEPETFATRVQDFFSAGGKGLNITVPFKQEACVLASILSPAAGIAGAVNTLVLDADGRLHGHNTDGIGLVQDILHNHGGKLAQASVLILGAGGATRGILQPLLQQQPSFICIANRTVSKAAELASMFSQHGQVQACTYEQLSGQSFDWVINATSASLHDELPPLPHQLLNPNAWCYDLMYSKEPTIFLRWAQQHGAVKIIDGLGMLVEQAAESFWIWRGVRPLTLTVLEALRNA